MSDVIKFPGETFVDLPADGILEAAKGQLDIAIIVGRDKNGKLYLAMSEASADATLTWLELARNAIIRDIERTMGLP